MRVKCALLSILGMMLSAAVPPLFSQVKPSATVRSLPLSVGVGVSSFDMDWGHGRMLGGTVWADWHPNRVPAFLRGIGLEAEARDISLGRQAAKPSNFRQDTAGGGVIYNWRHFNNFQPYAKYLIQLGSIDFRLKNDPAYAHDTRTVLTPGLGFEVHAVGNLWARADYEYQFWNNLFGQTLDPQGFTFGVAYRFSGPGRR